MFKTTQASDGSPTFNLKVTKTATNRFTASVPSRPEIQPVTAPTQSSAIAGVKKALDEAVKNNVLKTG